MFYETYVRAMRRWLDEIELLANMDTIGQYAAVDAATETVFDAALDSMVFGFDV